MDGDPPRHLRGENSLSSCGCQTGQDCGCHDGMHGYDFLGALTSDAAVEEIFPEAQVRSGVGHNQALRDLMKQSAEAGQIVVSSGALAYVPGTGQCSATGQSSNLKLAQTASGLALTGVEIGVAATAGGAVAG